MLEKPITRVIIAAVAAIAIMAGLALFFQYKPSAVLTIAQGTEPQVPVMQEPDDRTDSLAAQVEVDREVSANQIAYSDARVQALTKDAYNHYIAVVSGTIDGNIKAQMIVVGKSLTTGDYKTSYTTTSTGIVKVELVIKDGHIATYTEVPQPDDIRKVTYNESEQRAIDNILSDQTVKAKLAEKTGNLVVMYGGTIGSNTYDCGEGLCKLAVITLDGLDGPYLELMLDRNGKIVDLQGWITASKK